MARLVSYLLEEEEGVPSAFPKMRCTTGCRTGRQPQVIPTLTSTTDQIFVINLAKPEVEMDSSYARKALPGALGFSNINLSVIVKI